MRRGFDPLVGLLLLTVACLFAALLFGCAATSPYSRAPLPCQDQAVALVWRQQYHRAEEPPPIQWVGREFQTCGRVAANGARGFMTSAGCAGGVTFGGVVFLVWYGDWPSTALAHELAHLVDALEHRPPDFDHAGPMFAGGAVARANAALAAAHLCGP